MASRKSDKKPYTGILAEPMPKFTILTRPTDEELAVLIDTKFKALFDHYEIESADAFEGGPRMASAWANLAWHLARDHVPGFIGAPRGRGKPATRRADDVSLVMHVELLKRRDGLSERKAVKSIAERNLVSGSEEALLKRYKNAKPVFAPMVAMFDSLAAAAKGNDVFVRVMEESLFGDDKDTFLSPG
jgi:hypothetical protein